MAITLVKNFDGSATYIPDLDQNFTLLEDNVNTLLVASGSGSGSSGAVPTGLQQIFDRDGVIGIGSYQLTNQTVVGDMLTIPAGASWLSLTYRAKSTSTVLDTTTLTTGTRYINVDSGGNPVLADTSSVESVYSFSWNSGTKIITASTLLVDILFDGDDYNDMLDSAAQSKTFTSVAARLEDIEGQIAGLGSQYAQDLGTTTGLTFGWQAGQVRNDNVVTTTSAGTLLMTDNDVNYVEVHGTTGVVSTNLVGFTAGQIALYTVTAAAGVLTPVDERAWAQIGGAGGSHTQNTDLGTDAAEFKLNRLVAGAPTLNGSFKVERGSSNDVDLRWNETTDKWQFTNDGTVYSDIGSIDLGVQELTKTVMFEDPPLVVNVTAQSSGGSYVQVDLTADSDFTSIVEGLQGIILRVIAKDSAPGSGVNVLFRKIENPLASPTVAYTVLANDSAAADATRGQVIICNGDGRTMADVLKIGFEYQIFASGVNTFDLDVYVLGYMEKVVGAGTQSHAFASAGHTVALTTTTQFNLTGFLNRGLCHKFTIDEVGGLVTGNYNIKAYSKDTFLAADLLYQVDAILVTAPYEDYLPIWFNDADGTAELHISIENLDATNTGTYDITIASERFA